MQNHIYNLFNSFFLVPEFFLIFNVLWMIFFLLAKNIKTQQFFITNKTFRAGSFNLLNFIIFILFSLSLYFILLLNLVNQNFAYSFNSFLSNNFIIVLKLLITFFTMIILLFSWPYFKREFEFKSFEFFVLLLLSVIGMGFLLASNDFLTMYLTLELQSLCLYVLAGFKQNSVLSIESGLKYFVLGSFSSGLLLFGSSLIYGVIGSINFFDINLFLSLNTLLHHKFLVFFGLLLILSTILFKFTAAPFHMWAPDVYEGAPTIVTFYFSTVPKIAFFGLLVRLFSEVFISLDFYFITILISSSILSLILGSLTSLYQLKIKRFLAYSSISNVGFFLMAVVCANEESFTSGLIYLFIYLIVLVGIFSFILSLRYFHNNFKIKNINELLGLITINPAYSLIFLINFFSLIGMPPLAGFVGKFYLFLSCVTVEFFFLFFIAVCSSIFSAVIYLKIIRILFFGKTDYFYFYTMPERNFIAAALLTFKLNFLTLFFADDIFKLFYNLNYLF
jgi:NADH-quinone oxidoreductase subunit N